MKIDNNENNKKNNSGFTAEKFKEFCKDKKTRWLIIAFVVMVGVSVLQFVLPQVIK